MKEQRKTLKLVQRNHVNQKIKPKSMGRNHVIESSKEQFVGSRFLRVVIVLIQTNKKGINMMTTNLSNWLVEASCNIVLIIDLSFFGL